MTTSDKVRTEQAVIYVCRFISRIAEMATHRGDVLGSLDFDPFVLSVADEDMPGAIEGDVKAAAQAVYPEYAADLGASIDAIRIIKNIRTAAPPEYWQWAYPREVPWAHEGTVVMKRRMDDALNALFIHARQLYPLLQTL